MASLKKVATIAALASAGVVGMAGIAAADEGGYWDHVTAHQGGDDHLNQVGFMPINLLDNVDHSPNLGCFADQTFKDLTVQNPAAAGLALNHLLDHASLNLLSNGNTSTEVEDNSCTSNQGSSQAGNNSHHSVGAGSSASEHDTGNGAGSDNAKNGEGAGGLLGSSR